MLGRLNGAALNLLHKRATRAKLATGGKFDIDLAVGGVLNVFFQVELHDRVAARGAKHIGRGNCHRVFSGAFTLFFFGGGLSNGLS